MAAAPALTFHDWANAPDAIDALRSVAAIEPNSGGMCDPDRFLQGCYLASLDGRAWLALRQHTHPGGFELEVHAAAAIETGKPLSFAGLQGLDELARRSGAAVLSFQTPHATLAKLAQRRGYALAGYILRKPLKVQ